MNKKEIKLQYLKKIELIKKYNDHYYDKSNPLVTDQAYDKLKNEIEKLEIDYSFLNSENSPTKTVGHKPSKNFSKSLHKVPMFL